MTRPILALLILLATSGCVRLTMAWADLDPSERAEASPPVLEMLDGGGTVASAGEWQAQRPAIRQALEENVYGTFPTGGEARLVERRVIDDNYLGGLAVLEDWDIAVTAIYGGKQAEPALLHMAVMIPAAKANAPVILMETFCRNHNTFPGTDVWRPEGDSMCDGDGIMNDVMSYVFGRYIATPPLEEIARNGYAIAAFHPGDVVPDEAAAGQAALNDMAAPMTGDGERPGAIAAWGWLFSRAVDVLEADERLADSAMISWGHSRYGKAALVGAAWDDRIDGVIAHQSGTGGAALSKEKVGESVGQITDGYPHWFSDSYAAYAGREGGLPIDQHHLLALIAPRPVFLGNARRDVWSDPAGTFLAAQGADPAWELLGSEGLEQETLRSFDPQADISVFIRPGTHGITEEDWPAFLQFLDAHFR
ncbi:alpha/beta hydrolase [Parvularcula flava]|uniref:Acetylxylan esterase n=1 Tax=Aquisalinus luteolus TaxID=1566827 RepID=A0A8J3AAH9_9PROT|nr:alpha/beta hydrolase [Aquisalinus luteolus]NHK29471.1 alpha/beta hydrolase [Aquisalinus luteolus]GGI01844.1 acetylxylan esterase [Aquisalinus luteolus]